MSQITTDQVSQSYNGKSGCMCGCNGTYKFPVGTDLAAENKKIGYEGYDEKSISDRSVKIAVSKINEALEQHKDQLVDGKFRGYGVSVGRTEAFAWIDQGGRNTVVYFKK